MKIISIVLGKIVLFMCKLIGRGSAFPGTFTYRINKKIIKQLKKPSNVICVTGSSGKGSTCNIIAKTLRDFGYKVGFNDKGSNELSAIVTTMLECSSITGKCKVDFYVFETDERYTKYIYPDLKPNYVIITNITRDQPPRQRNFDFVRDEIKKAITSDMHLVINGDDPYLRSFVMDNQEISYYSIEKNKYSYKDNFFNPLNISRCPKCLKKLKYNYYNFEYLGDYYCDCGFKREESLCKITNIDYDNKIITINDKYKIKESNDMLFSFYNTLAAFTMLSLLNLDKERISNYISSINKDLKIYNNYRYKDRDVFVLNNKNENATTFNQSILYTMRNSKKKTIVIGWWQISRRYDFDDLSWLYDICFEELVKQDVDKYILCGPQRYDIAVRLKYAGVDERKIKICTDIKSSAKDVSSSSGDIYAILNFDYIKPFNQMMEEIK